MKRWLACVVLPLVGTAQVPCGKLVEVKLPGVTVSAAEFADKRCRVALTLTPSADSDIKSEVWLPPAGAWNGKLLMVGGGGFVGSINQRGLAGAVSEGYAGASTDTGHTGGDGSFALGHPEKVVDFAYRAVHETVVAAKTVIAAHYGRPARLAYWEGCSTGGRQGLMEAQRYPEDFDGIIAGAPANNQIQLCAWRMRVMVASLRGPDRAISQAKKMMLHNAVLDACDTQDGVADRLLTDPRKCGFDPAALACRGGDREDCLTAGELETVKLAYTDAVKKSGELIYPRLPKGTEPGWLLPGNATEPGGIDLGMFRYVARQDRNWDWRTFDLESDTDLAMKQAGFIHATNPDLSKFKARGGKLLIYHGWSDGGSGGAISAFNTLSYYESVLAKMGPDQSGWLRLFLVPGMAHCGGGTGPNQFSALAALERWREKGAAPDRIIAARVSNGRVDMTRPLCPHPQVAVYSGSGSTNDAGNFVCKLF